MKVLSVEFHNFKLLEDVRISISTDPTRPLTVIRAENGSGKTSLLYGLLWGFYGGNGLPERARELRLTSSANRPGRPVDIQVAIEFEQTDDNGVTSRYRLLRTATETPRGGDAFERTPDRLRLLRLVDAGSEDVGVPEAVIDKFLPERLRNVFFTNGDDIQTFISGRVSNQHRQEQVHQAIRSLLGLAALSEAKGDLDPVFKRFRSEAARTAGADAAEAEEQLEETDRQMDGIIARRDKNGEGLRNMISEKMKWEKELTGLRGIGDIDELNSQIESVRKDIKREEETRSNLIAQMKEAMKSEGFSWAFLKPQMESGIAILSELADRRVIPGSSVQVIADRLELKECICGEALLPGTARRLVVERLRDEQQAVSESRQRLTALFHSARQGSLTQEVALGEGKGFAALRTGMLAAYTKNRDVLQTKRIQERQLTERRGKIDETRVRDLVEKIAKVEAQIAKANTDEGKLSAEVTRLNELREKQQERAKEAEKAAQINSDLATKRDIAEDLLKLTQGTLDILQSEYVKKVSEGMNALFMSIVGAVPAEFGPFRGVHIDSKFNIIIDTHNDGQLDADFELNGASQRALTLAFIWSLMEVSGVAAPRIIDTPLGMVAGGVKSRMVETITCSTRAGQPERQVVLLLTRSEIRDVEELLDRRAGKVCTMTCSKDYPEDLVRNWNVDHPLVRVCQCNHRQSCRICARRYDQQHGITFRDVEG
jgi:DNA sulfur modification protein DndD